MSTSAIENVLALMTIEETNSSGQGTYPFDEKDEAMHRAMGNPVILDEIFSKLDIPNLKTIRQVCTFWGEVGCSALSNRTVLPFRKVFPSYAEGIVPSTINGKLAKNVQIWLYDTHGYYGHSSGLNAFVGTNFAKLAPHIKKTMEDIRISADGSSVMDVLKIINYTEFAKLSNISIMLKLDNEDFTVVPPLFRMRPSVKCIELKFVRQSMVMHRVAEYIDLLQKLLDSSPNLEVLKIEGNFYPDLSNCSKLKILKYSEAFSVILEMEEVNRMISQVRSTLIVLELGYEFYDEGAIIFDGEFRLPTMSNLTTLNVLSAQIYHLRSNLDKKLVPKLRNLSVKTSISSRNYTVNNCLANLWKPHDRIVSLKFESNAGPEVTKKLARLFPNVKKINIGLSPTGMNLLQFQEMIEAYNAWNLIQAKVVFKSVNRIEEIGIILNAMSTWNGYRSITLLAGMDGGEDLFTDLFSGMMKDAFLSCKSSAAVGLLHFGGLISVHDEMEEFIRINNLPIRFQSCNWHRQI